MAPLNLGPCALPQTLLCPVLDCATSYAKPSRVGIRVVGGIASRADTVQAVKLRGRMALRVCLHCVVT